MATAKKTDVQILKSLGLSDFMVNKIINAGTGNGGTPVVFDGDEFTGAGTLLDPKSIVKAILDSDYFSGAGTALDKIKLKLKTVGGEEIFGAGDIVLPEPGEGSQSPLVDHVDGNQKRIDNLVGLQVKKVVAGTPTYATWNPADKSANVLLSGGNLVATGNGDTGSVRSTIGVNTGKHYVELKCTGFDTANSGFGIAKSTMSLASWPGNLDANGYAVWGFGFDKVNNANYQSYITGQGSLILNKVINLKIDMDNKTIEFGLDGVYYGVAYSGLSGTFYVTTGNFGNTNAITANFGATAFAYPVPAGYNAGLYTGSGGSTEYGIFVDEDTQNVGIGKEDPTEKLDVAGNIKADGKIQAGSNIEAVESVIAKRIIGDASLVPSIGEGAGAGPGLIAVNVTGNDIGGQITVITAGSMAAAANAIVATIIFGTAYNQSPAAVILTPANAVTAALTSDKKVYVKYTSITPAVFELWSGVTALTTGTTYSWMYMVVGTNQAF
jgi:hypothetical protein